MNTFEDITAQLVQDLGPMDVPEEPELLVSVYPTVGNVIQFTVSCGIQQFRDYVSNVLQYVEYMDFVDTHGHAHIIRTDAIIRVEIEEENNGDASAPE